jgi:hypothetical protein
MGIDPDGLVGIEAVQSPGNPLPPAEPDRKTGIRRGIEGRVVKFMAADWYPGNRQTGAAGKNALGIPKCLDPTGHLCSPGEYPCHGKFSAFHKNRFREI